uniref:C2H2-type domain-containing protein n=1 Tax=Amphilophus citrinellus TaxID=61819 RepID=A0A3Q0R096_AMPCI
MTQPVSTAPLQQLLSDIKEEPVDESCDERLSDNSNLTCKLDRALNIEPPKQFFCQDCNMTFVNKAGLSGHLRTHAVGRPFNCKSCNKGFWNKSLLRNHYRKCRNGRIPNQQLETPLKANFDFALNELMDNSSSQVSTTGDSDEDENNGSEDSDSDSAPYFPCHVCGKTFPTSESLEDHQLCHLGEKPHECEQCGKCFFQSSQLQQHQRMHKSEFQCQTCGRGFVSLFALRKHKHNHGKNRSLRCSKCNIFFTGPSQLAEHMSIHREENFPCDICNRVFLSKSSRAEEKKEKKKKTERRQK